MFKLPKTITAFAVVPMAAALVAVGLVAGPAAADPPGPAVGTASYCGGGSDTTQDIVQKLAGTVTSDGSTQPTSTGKTFESWNARGSSTITTNCAPGQPFNRPDGSSAGINTLRIALNLEAPSNPCVAAPTLPVGAQVPCNGLTFARSSRGPNDTSTTDLMWVPFGVDAVGVAVLNSSVRVGALDSFYSGGLSVAQLQDIYKCVTKTVSVGGKTYQVQPYVPQAGSGTRSFFLTAVGITEADVNKAPALGGCVRDTKVDTGATMQEHDGTVLTDPSFTPATSTWDTSCDAGDTCYTEITPFSIAQWIAQTNHLTTGATDRRGNAKLLSLGGQAPTVAGPPLQINNSWPGAYKRDVYNVFLRTKVTGLTADANLKKLFVGNSAAVCLQTSLINAYGFLTNANCGDTTGIASKTGKR